MHHLIKRSFLILMSIAVATSVKADPGELNQINLTRTAQNGLVLQTQLTKNIFREESYQDTYITQVPYQDTETYYVDVPYQDTETYYTSDNVCQPVTSYQHQCHTEHQCNYSETFKLALGLDGIDARPNGPLPGPGGGGPGGGHPGGGGPNPGPRPNPGPGPRPPEPPRPTPPAPRPPEPPRPTPPAPRPPPPPRPPEPPRPTPPAPRPPEPPRPTPPAPRPPPPPRPPEPPRPPMPPPPRPPEPPRPPQPPRPPAPVCTDRQVCVDVPVTTQQCTIVQTPHTRSVTKYRQEARTRTVTKYRDEQDCCVTKTREVFDHQWALNVQVQFPQGTELQGNESESFTLQISGDESAPDAVLTPISTVFGYQVASKTVSQGQLIIVLQQVPRYQSSDLGQSTIQSLQVIPNAQGVSYSFVDKALLPRISSSQQFMVADAVTNEILATTEVGAITQSQNQASLGVALDASRSYVAILKIHREGTVLDQPVDFEIHQPISLQVDSASLSQDSKITAAILGNQAAATLSFTDATANYSSVVTNYTITIARKANGKTTSIAAKSFARSALTLAADGSFQMPLSQIVAATDLQNYVTTGQSILVVVEVRRQVAGQALIQFWKDNWVQIQ